LNRLYHRPELVTEQLIDSRTAINSLPGVAEARKSWKAYGEALLAREPEQFRRFELRACLPALDIPSVLIWGREDRFAPVSIGRDLAPLLPRTTYIEVEGGGHAVYRDQAATVNDLLRRVFSSDPTEVSGARNRSAGVQAHRAR
jgi:pimeloyl-ACP methyl ester carboxylesterase